MFKVVLHNTGKAINIPVNLKNNNITYQEKQVLIENLLYVNY